MKKIKLIAITAFIIIVVVLFLFRDNFTFKPWLNEQPLEWMGAVSGNEKAIAVIADSAKKIVVINHEGELIYKVHAGMFASRSFDSAKHAILDNENNLYVHDNNFGAAFEENTERILKYSPKGKFLGVVYSYTYTNNDFIITKGKISGIAVDGDILYIARLENDGFYLERINVNQTEETPDTVFFPYSNAFRELAYCRINTENKRLVWTTQSGIIYDYSFTGSHNKITADDNIQPYMALSDNNNNIVYTDVWNNVIGLIDTYTGINTVLYQNREMDGLFYNYISSHNNTCFASYLADDMLLINANGDYKSISSYTLPKAEIIIRFILFSLFFIGSIIFILLLVWTSIYLKKKKASPLFKQILLFGLCILLGASISTLIIINEMQKNNTEKTYQELENISRLMATYIDIDLINELRSPKDFYSDRYREFSDRITSLFSELNLKGEQIGCLIWVERDGVIYTVYDLEYAHHAYHPWGDFEGSYVEEVHIERNYKRFREPLPSGIWEYVMGPVFDKDGNIIATIEVDLNVQSFERNNRNMIIQIALIVLASTVAFLLIVIECLSMFDAFNKRKKMHSGDNIIEVKQNALKSAITFLLNSYKKEFNKDGYVKVASRSYGTVINRLVTTYKTGLSSDFQPELLRAAAFFMYFSINFASAILPLYSAELYIPLFNIPREFFITLPFVALSSFIVISLVIVPRLLYIVGVKKISFISGVIILAGNILCVLANNIISLSLGYALIGLSCGAFSLIFNTIIGSQKNASDVNNGFAHLSASYISGLNAGVVCGAMIAQFFPYRLLFVFSALIAFLFLIMIVYSLRSSIFSSLYESTGMVTRLRKVTMVKDLIKNKSNENFTFIKFIFKPVVVCILFLAFVPYVISMNFSEYFMPVFAMENGLGEANIGQLMLLSGLFAILFSASLCRLMAKKVPVLLSVILPLFLNAAAFFIFSLNVSVSMLIVTIILLAIVNIFAFANIQTYFTLLYQENRISSVKALGLFSIVENLSMGVGPIVFSYIIANNISAGMKILSWVIAGGAVLLIVISRFSVKWNNEPLDNITQ